MIATIILSARYSGGIQTANSAYSVPNKSVECVFPNLVMQIRIFRCEKSVHNIGSSLHVPAHGEITEACQAAKVREGA